jgi:hypothetical protein
MNRANALEQKIKKYKAFYADNTPGQIIATIAPYTFEIDYPASKSKPLNQWNFETEVENYVDACIGDLRHYMDYTHELDNAICPLTCRASAWA